MRTSVMSPQTSCSCRAEAPASTSMVDRVFTRGSRLRIMASPSLGLFQSSTGTSAKACAVSETWITLKQPHAVVRRGSRPRVHHGTGPAEQRAERRVDLQAHFVAREPVAADG